MTSIMTTAMSPRVMCLRAPTKTSTLPKSRLDHRLCAKVPTRAGRVLHPNTRCAAASTEPSPSSSKAPAMPLNAALRVLHSLSDGATPGIEEVFEAVRAVVKAKPSVDYEKEIAGPGDSMRRWQLVYTVKGSDVADANAGKASKLGAYWAVFPACLGYAGDGGHENGVYLASGALSIRFEGLYDLQGSKLGFDFSKLTVKVGPWKVPFTLKEQVPASYDNLAQAPGFFMMLYADEKIMIARGKSGGVALWIRAKPSWLLARGIA